MQVAEIKDFDTFYFLLGRLVRILIVPQPLPIDSFETEFLSRIVVPIEKLRKTFL